MKSQCQWVYKVKRDIQSEIWATHTVIRDGALMNTKSWFFTYMMVTLYPLQEKYITWIICEIRFFFPHMKNIYACYTLELHTISSKRVKLCKQYGITGEKEWFMWETHLKNETTDCTREKFIVSENHVENTNTCLHGKNPLV